MWIDGIEVAFPEHVIETPDISHRIGVKQRYVSAEHETALDLALAAYQKMECPLVEAIVFVTQTPDYIMPSNASLFHKLTEMPDQVIAFDVNLACSGWVYGLGIAQGLIEGGLAEKVLLITADTYSKYLNPDDPTTYPLFGDGAALTLLGKSGFARVSNIRLFTSGNFESFFVAGGGCKNPHQKREIKMDGAGIVAFASTKVLKLLREEIARHQPEGYVFHQASNLVLDRLAHKLKITNMYRNLERVGNTVSASIPIALHEFRPKGKILTCGFGVGLSWGTAIYEDFN